MKRSKGFTLIELIVFIIIVGLASGAMFAGMQTALRKSKTVKDDMRALFLAQQRMELILGQKKQTGFTSFVDPCVSLSFPASLCASGAFSFGYTVSSTISSSWNSDTSLKQITVTVTGPQSVTLTTVVGNY